MTAVQRDGSGSAGGGRHGVAVERGEAGACAGPDRQRRQEAVARAVRIGPAEQPVRPAAHPAREQLVVALEAPGRKDHGAGLDRGAPAVRLPDDHAADGTVVRPHQPLEGRARGDPATVALDEVHEAVGHPGGVDLLADLPVTLDRRTARHADAVEPFDVRQDVAHEARLPDPVAARDEFQHHVHVGCGPDPATGHPHRPAGPRTLLDHEGPCAGFHRARGRAQPGHPGPTDDDVVRLGHDCLLMTTRASAARRPRR